MDRPTEQAESLDHGNGGYTRVPESGTGACERFFLEHMRLAHFVGFVAALATRADEVVRVARQALDEPELDPSKGALSTLRRHRQLLLQMTLSRGVENYLAYLSEVLALLFETRPETMRAKIDDDSRRRGTQPEAVPLDLILEHTSMEELIAFLTERRVNELSYKGMAGITAYVSEKLAFSLFEDEEMSDRIVHLVEIRNLIAHNRGVVNRTYKRRVGDDSLVVGARIELDVNDVFDDLERLAGSVADIDARAVAKWALPSSEFERRPLLEGDS